MSIFIGASGGAVTSVASGADNRVAVFNSAASLEGDANFTWDGAALSALLLNTAQGADIASGATINLDTATGNLVDVTGTTTITAVTLSQGRQRVVRFTGALTLTNGASLVLPGAANITTAAGDYAFFVGYAAGVVRCASYVKANGQAVVASGNDIGCRVYNDANISIDSGVTTALTFNQERYDTDTMHSTSSNTGRITFTTAGKYIIGCTLDFLVDTAGAIMSVYFRLNGATVIAATRDATLNPEANLISFSTEYNFAAADYVEITVNQNSGVAKNVRVVANYSPEFWARKVDKAG